MRYTTAVITAALIAGAAAPAQAQEVERIQPRGATNLLALHTAARPEAVREQFARAERLHRSHRLRQALAAYERVVELQDSRRELPAVSLRRIANIRLAEGRRVDAARTMDRLAQRAGALGRPGAEAKALLEAAALYQAAGRQDAARDRVQRLEQLITSPHIQPSEKAAILARLERG